MSLPSPKSLPSPASVPVPAPVPVPATVRRPASLLSLRDLGVRFPAAVPGGPEITALHEVSLTVEAGRIVGLTGGSGAGKTTLGHAVLRLLPRHARVEGRVLFDGEDVLAMPWGRLREVRWAGMSLVVQDGLRGLDPLRRIGPQVAAPILLHRGGGRRAARSRAADLLARVGLPERAARAYPHELSGGQRQRALLAMALCCDPRLIVADEPTTDLDDVSAAAVLDLVADHARRRGAAVLLISHDVAMLTRRADEVAVLSGGRLSAGRPPGARPPGGPAPGGRADPRPIARATSGPVPRAGGPAPLQARRVTVHPPGQARPVLDGVSLTLWPGEIVGLVGPSGAGKTTLARTLAGLRRPSAGAVLADGQPVPSAGPALRRFRAAVQYLPQNAAETLDPAHRVGRAVTEGLRIHHPQLRPSDRVAAGLLDDVGLRPGAAFVDRLPAELSAGQRQRVALAAALAVRPRVLLADEPTAGLDAAARDVVLHLLRRLSADTGTAVLLVSHDPDAVRLAVTRTLRLTPAGLVEEPPP